MTVDALASQPQYLAHLLPVFEALPDGVRGTLHLTGPATMAAPAHVPFTTQRPSWRRPNPILVASYADLLAVRPRPAVLMEHGAGQSYLAVPGEDAHPSYAGGRERENVVLFLCPNERVAAANCAAWPEAPSVVVGSPYVERLQADVSRARAALPLRNKPLTVAFTFHFDCRATAPEARSAMPAWWPTVCALVADPGVLRLIGHGHPKDTEAQERWRTIGVEWVPNLVDVLAQADVLVVDNSSVAFEAVACGVGVVLLDAPWYRRDVEHGLRFWARANIGPRPPATLDGLRLAFGDSWHPRHADARSEAVAACYGPIDGNAAQRAVTAILGVQWETVVA